jgi:SAM-dependent methyltransferase
LILTLERFGTHDEVYDAEYYQSLVDPTMLVSATTMAASIADAFNPSSVVDVGCGGGHLLDALRKLGVGGTGLEYSSAALAICRAKGLCVVEFDLEHDATPPLRADVVISTEVAEHLPLSCADRFVDILTALADIVVLTAAVPSGEGTDHVNEQPNEYWIEKFSQRSYKLDEELSMRWRERWGLAGVAHCFSSSVMVFRKPARN